MASLLDTLFSIDFSPFSLQVVLLARDTPTNHPAVKELGLDLALWQPLIVDRQFVDWLVKHPSDQVGCLVMMPQSTSNDDRPKEKLRARQPMGT